MVGWISLVAGIKQLFQQQKRLPKWRQRFVKNGFKGTNGRQKTYEISYVYSIFYSGFMCQTTVIFG